MQLLLHALHITLHHGFGEPGQSARLCEPVLNHLLKHQPDLQIRQRHCIQGFLIRPDCFQFRYHMDSFQISRRQQQAPYRVRIRIQLIIDDLLIHRHRHIPTLQQNLKLTLDLRLSRTKELPDQAIAAGVCPISIKLSRVQVIRYGPGIVNVCHRAECETIIPALHLLPVVFSEPLFLQGFEHLLFPEAEAVCIHI